MKYRERIYGHYVDAACDSLAPETIAGLATRGPALARFITAHFPPARDAAILELGCGHGALLHFAWQAGYTNVSGIDGSPAQIEAAQRLGIAGVKSGEIMPTLRATPAASLDAVIAYDVIEHLTKDELMEVTDEVFRCLKPGGRWIVRGPNGMSPFCGIVVHGDLTHELAFTPESLTQLFLTSGFKSVTFAEVPPTPHGLKSTVRAVLWQLIRQLYRFILAVETGMTKYRVLTINLIAVAVK